MYHSGRRSMARIPLRTVVRLHCLVATSSLIYSACSGNILKPSLDLVLFTSQPSRSLGFRGNYYATITILRAVTPAFGRLAVVEARLEGEYRAGMGQRGREAEEIAYVTRLHSHIQLPNEYLQVLQWWTEGKGRFDESIPKIDQTRQPHLQSAPVLFHATSTDVLLQIWAALTRRGLIVIMLPP